jgi:hypothetical protein
MRFSNNKICFLKNIDSLPDVLIIEIYEYIPKIVKLFLTKENYLQYHYLLKEYINKKNKNIEKYFRTMVRQDNDFVFQELLVENYKKWFNMTNYYYNSCIYRNYITFIESYAIENESIKCRKIINNLFEELGLSKNQHKKNIIKYIRWKA